jgi:hypothetical protein
MQAETEEDIRDEITMIARGSRQTKSMSCGTPP